MNVTIKGMDKLNRLLRSMPREVEEAANKELKIIVMDLQGKAQDLAPVDMGDLVGSGFSEANDLKGVVGFTEPYAMIQHEAMEFKHPKGGQAKYLEQPYKENTGKYIKGMGDAVERAVDK